MGTTSESELGHDAATAMRMIDYVQSVITAVPPSPQQRTEVTEEEWTALHEKIERLFGRLSLDYQLCATAHERAAGTAQDLDFEEFKYRAQVYWCNVRGARYQVHQPAYLRDMFLPFSEMFREFFGITAEQFVGEITKIWRSLTYGFGDAAEEFESFRTEVLDATGKLIDSDDAAGEEGARAAVAKVIEERGWQERQERALGRFLGLDLFDVQKVPSPPEQRP
jgi:hypothetical protein